MAAGDDYDQGASITWERSQSEWEAIRRDPWSKTAVPKDWPAGVQGISLEAVGLLGLDKEGRLYWDGKPVEVRQRLVLSIPQKVWVVVLAVAGLLAALGSAVQGWAAGHDWLCKVGWIVTWCQS